MSPARSRIPPPRRPIDLDEAVSLYEEEGLTAAEIARRMGYSAKAMREALKRSGVSLQPKRSISEARWGDRLYRYWIYMRKRCTNPRHPRFARFGARGFAVCREWDEDFWRFYDWAAASGYGPGMTLEVTGRSRRFSPRTCRWITPQQRMQRDGHPGGTGNARAVKAFGESKSISVWARDPRCTVTTETLRTRLQRGVPPETAITAPKGSRLPKDARRARPPKGPRKLLDWNEIVRLHRDLGLTANEIARRVNANHYGIRKGLKARGVWQPVHLPYERLLRKILDGARIRCEDPTHPAYPYTGARGARICDAWSDFRAFHAWALEAGYRPGLCLARREGTRIYSPKNCFWATRAEIRRLVRFKGSAKLPRWTVEAFGETKGPTAWARDPRCEVSVATLVVRLRSGMRPEEAIATPSRRGAERPGRRFIEAFGTTKCLADWSRDRRCKVSKEGLRRRLERGVPPEKAITTPPYRE